MPLRQIDRRTPDFIASLLVPGWTQGMYGRRISAWLFFIAIAPAWVLAVMLGWWLVPLTLHLAAGAHALQLSVTTRPPGVVRVPHLNA